MFKNGSIPGLNASKTKASVDKHKNKHNIRINKEQVLNVSMMSHDHKGYIINNYIYIYIYDMIVFI